MALLPGLRDVRSSLISGYMWVIAVWLLAAQISPSILQPQQHLSAAANALLNFLGDAGAIAVLSVASLLVGDFTSGLAQRFTFRLSHSYVNAITATNIDRIPTGWRNIFRPFSLRVIDRILRLAMRSRDTGDRDKSLPADQILEEDKIVAVAVLRELLYLAPRLIFAKPELHAEYDRMRAESEFRDAIVVPLPVLTVAILLNVEAHVALKLTTFAFVMLLDVFLFFQARDRFRDAHSLVGHSVADGTIGAAALEDGSHGSKR